MAITTVGHKPEHASSSAAKTSQSGFGETRRERRRPWRRKADPQPPAAGRSPFPNPGGDTEILPPIPSASPVEVVEHFTPAQLDPVPVLAAIGEDAARATGGKIPLQEASRLLHKHLAALDWRLAQTRRSALNRSEAEADAANLAAADEAAAKLGARVVVDSRAMVDTILRRADMRSNPMMHTQRFQNVSAATEFPAPMAGGVPTIGEQRPARDLGPGDFLLDVDDMDAPDPLSMWRLVERVEVLDERIVAVLVDDRSLGFAPDELVWLLPPLAGRRHRDEAVNGHERLRPVAPVSRPAIPDEQPPGPEPLPQRAPHLTVISAPVGPDGAPLHGHRIDPATEDFGSGDWVFRGADDKQGGPVWRQVKSVDIGDSSTCITYRNEETQTVRRGNTVRVLSQAEARELLAQYGVEGMAS